MKKYKILFFFILFTLLFSNNFSYSADKGSKKEKFDRKEMVDKAKIYFADLSEGVGIIIERSFNDFGQPSAYIEGEEFSGAFFGGFRYGGAQMVGEWGVAQGVLLPFGEHKGSAIAMMVELLAAGLVGDMFSFEAKEEDNNDGGPARGGEFILAISPELIAGKNWAEHSEKFFENMLLLDGVRLPGQRRHKNRLSDKPRRINTDLVEKIKKLI